MRPTWKVVAAWLLLACGALAVYYGITFGSLLDLPFPDEPPPEVLAAHRSRLRSADAVGIAGVAAFVAALIWLLVTFVKERLRRGVCEFTYRKEP